MVKRINVTTGQFRQLKKYGWAVIKQEDQTFRLVVQANRQTVLDKKILRLEQQLNQLKAKNTGKVRRRRYGRACYLCNGKRFKSLGLHNRYKHNNLKVAPAVLENTQELANA